VLSESRHRRDDHIKQFDAKMLSLSNALWPIYDVDNTHMLDNKKLVKLVSHYMRQFREYIPRFWTRHLFARVDKAIHDHRVPHDIRKRIALEWNEEKSRAVKTLSSNYLEYIDNIETHVQEWMDIMDTNHDGLISKEEFTKNFLSTTAVLGIDLDGSIRAYGLDDKVRDTLERVDNALGKGSKATAPAGAGDSSGQLNEDEYQPDRDHSPEPQPEPPDQQ